MKKILLGLALVLATSSANASFFDSNNGEWKMGPNGPYYDESDWPEWTPMYWMEEFMDMWGDDDNNSFGGMPMMGGSNNHNYAQPMMPAPQAPYMPTAPVPAPK